MRAIRAMLQFGLLSVALMLPATMAHADQSDGRLDSLFVELSDASNPVEAEAVAREIWSIWHEHDDRAVRLLMAKGLQAMQRADNRKALEVFDQMIRIAPEFAEAWNKRATVNYLLREFEASLDDIDKTLALEPRHFGALSGRGLVYVAMEEPELAIEAFEDALAVHPQMVGPKINAETLREQLKKREI